MATIYNTVDLTPLKSLKPRWVKKYNNSKREYLNLAIGYDIETSSFEYRGAKCSVVYSHAIAINDMVWHFRTWDEIEKFFDALVEFFGAGGKKYIVIYIHHLTYEYNFIRTHQKFLEVFANGTSRNIMWARRNGIEFRCSRMESGMTLEKVSEKTTVKKLTGDIDHSLLRTPITKLTSKELAYIYNDVLIITEYINMQMKANGYNIARIPYTQTGYVRRELVAAYKKAKGRALMKKLVLTPQAMASLRKTYHGGFTHANAAYVGKQIPNVASIDATSFYPTQFVSHKFPMGAPIIANIPSPESIEDMVDDDNICVQFKARVDVVLKNVTGIYSESRAEDAQDLVVDNGRIASGTFTGHFTDADWKAFRLMYDYEIIDVYDVIIYKADYLPDWFVGTMLKFYADKTLLKNVLGKEEEYSANKGKLNSFYGMGSTDPIRAEFRLSADGNGLMIQELYKDILLATEAHNSDKNRAVYYPWAVWCTAYAQLHLIELIDALGDDWVYSDTDSLKFINPEKHLDMFKAKSEEVYAEIRKCLDAINISHDQAFAVDVKGNIHPLGEWSYEGTYDYFKTLGSKRYMTAVDGKIQITCSGVSKSKGSAYLSEGNTVDQAFAMFNDGLVIPAGMSGRTVHTYIDEPRTFTITDYQGNVYHGTEKSGIHMEETDYHLGISENFAEYLKKICNNSLTKDK